MVAQNKETETLTKYLGDMHALEAHILQAIDKQDKLLAAGHPEAKEMITTFRSTAQRHATALESRMQELGGSPTHPVKEAVAAFAGVVAGLYDKVRNEEASKDLRDDYTALNHAIIAYVMLHTTALAFKDQQTATLAMAQMQDYSRFVMQINAFMPEMVMQEFRQDGGFQLDETATTTAQKNLEAAWKESARQQR